MALGTWNELAMSRDLVSLSELFISKARLLFSCKYCLILAATPSLYTNAYCFLAKYTQTNSKWCFQYFFPWHRWKNNMSSRKPITDSQRTTLEPELLDGISQSAFTFEAPRYTEFNSAQESCTELMLLFLLYEGLMSYQIKCFSEIRVYSNLLLQ